MQSHYSPTSSASKITGSDWSSTQKTDWQKRPIGRIFSEGARTLPGLPLANGKDICEWLECACRMDAPSNLDRTSFWQLQVEGSTLAAWGFRGSHRKRQDYKLV